MTLREVLDLLWTDYVAITPDARRIHDLLAARGETIVNDHVAFRTFNLEPIGLESLAAPFRARGYLESGTYDFPEKRLRAKSFVHPGQGVPYLFISELLVERFPDPFQEIVRSLVAQVPTARIGTLDLLTARPSWKAPTQADYLHLQTESHYAAWLSAFGLRINHCTVSVNGLHTFPSIQELNRFLLDQGFTLNEAGGLVKGTPETLLEQSSTMANRIPWDFSDGRLVVPSCYYEFARRYPDPWTGGLYAGFFAPSANRIFESTDAKETS